MIKHVDYFIFYVIYSPKSIFSIGFTLGIICFMSSCGRMAFAIMLKSSRVMTRSRVYAMVVPNRIVGIPR